MGTATQDVATCVGCGCDDNHACPFGCSWLRVDRKKKVGVCSECPAEVRGWDAKQRKAPGRVNGKLKRLPRGQRSARAG